MVARVLPRIGITTTSIQRPSMSLGVQRPTETLDGAYVDATRNAGGIPYLLPNTDPDLAEAYVEPLDGLMLSGGADIDPARYGAEPHPETHPPDPGRDAFELAVLRVARERDLPVLGICRGMQLINVAHGGTLIQHVPDVTNGEHRDLLRWNVPSNPVCVEEGTRLHDVLGRTQILVNSLHHQAVDQMAPGFRRSAHDHEEIIEAIEADDGAPVLGVQWHPEMLATEPVHQLLFSWLVHEASRRRQVVRSG
jgi:gamma-glutamyl-gamma-aminobutyrate hydrolase PuuD